MTLPGLRSIDGRIRPRPPLRPPTGRPPVTPPPPAKRPLQARDLVARPRPPIPTGPQPIPEIIEAAPITELPGVQELFRAAQERQIQEAGLARILGLGIRGLARIPAVRRFLTRFLGRAVVPLGPTAPERLFRALPGPVRFALGAGAGAVAEEAVKRVLPISRAPSPPSQPERRRQPMTMQFPMPREPGDIQEALQAEHQVLRMWDTAPGPGVTGGGEWPIFALMADGHMAVWSPRTGKVKHFRPARNIVISRNPRIRDIRKVQRIHSRIERMLRPFARKRRRR